MAGFTKWLVATGKLPRDPLAPVRKPNPDKDRQPDFLAEKNHAGQTLDFHALRHTCGAWLVLSGVNVKIVQVVMRHSTSKLTLDTMDIYCPGRKPKPCMAWGVSSASQQQYT
jgi:hypothetical protein